MWFMRDIAQPCLRVTIATVIVTIVTNGLGRTIPHFDVHLIILLRNVFDKLSVLRDQTGRVTLIETVDID
jgi:hypothetical protein